MPITGTFEQVSGFNSDLVRKMLKMAVFIGAYETAPVITTITDSSNALVIPDGYESIGWMTADQGASITPSLEVSEVAGYGAGQPIRRDIVSRNTALGLTMSESKRRVFEAYYGADLSAVQATPSPKNELSFDQPELPEAKYWRVLCLGRDGRGTAAKYHAEFFPRMTLTDVGERQWSATEPMGWPITLGADTDTAVGTPQRSFWAGPGMSSALITAMGFVRSA